MEFKSCYLMGHGISIEEKIIRNCCLATPTNAETPVLLKNYDPENIDWETLFKTKKEFREQQKISELEGCKGCYNLETVDWDENKYISHINFNHWKNCNSRCIYCYTRNMVYPQHNNIYESIKKLVNSEYFKEGGEITFQGGEPTILEEFDDLVDLFIQKNTKMRVHSSGIHFSYKAAHGIHTGLLTIVISIDAGTPETYYKIKNVRSFNKVCENIKEYAKRLHETNKGHLKVKYIIVPGINDSVEEIDKWFDIVTESKVKDVIVDVEYSYARQNLNSISEHVYLLMDYIKYRAEKAGITFDTYDSAIYALKSRTIKEQKQLLKHKLLYKLLVNYYKKKNQNKNLKYT